MNGDSLAGIIADAPIAMPPDEDVGHSVSVAASFSAQQAAAPVSDPPKTLNEYLRVMTIEQAKNVKVDFGRFSGWTLGEIAVKNPGDLAWYVKNYSGHNLALKAGATKLMEAVGQLAG